MEEGQVVEWMILDDNGNALWFGEEREQAGAILHDPDFDDCALIGYDAGGEIVEFFALPLAE